MKRITNLFMDVDRADISFSSTILFILGIFVAVLISALGFIASEWGAMATRALIVCIILTIPAFIESRNLHKDD